MGEYLRATGNIAESRQRTPPPTPRDFPVVEIQLSVASELTFADVQVLPAGSFQASSDQLEISVGEHALRRNKDGSLALCVAHPGRIGLNDTAA